MTLGYREDAGTRVAEITVGGRITQEDFDAIAPRIDAFARAHAPIRLLEIVHHLDGMEPGVLWPALQLEMRLLRRVGRCAVVGDAALLSPLARAAAAFSRIELRRFATAELEAARVWVAEPAAVTAPATGGDTPPGPG